MDRLRDIITDKGESVFIRIGMDEDSKQRIVFLNGGFRVGILVMRFCIKKLTTLKNLDIRIYVRQGIRAFLSNIVRELHNYGISGASSHLYYGDEVYWWMKSGMLFDDVYLFIGEYAKEMRDMKIQEES